MNKSHNQDQDAARERLLDASLAEVLGRRASPSGEQPFAAPGQSRRHRWAAAAFVLLGAAVVVGSWVTAEPSQKTPAAPNTELQDPVPQDPQPIPWPTNCETVADLEAAPGDKLNLSVKLSSTSDLELLARFTKLRELTIRGSSKDSFWALVELDGAVLRPLQKLQKLERLTLPSSFALRPEHVRSLRSLPALRSITVVFTDPLPDAIAREFAALPGLRELEFRLCHVTASFLEILKPIGLTHLGLCACPAIEQVGLDAITAMKSLQSLALTSRSDGGCRIGGRRYKLAKMGRPEFAMLNALPNLTGLDLDESHFHDRFMSQLPPKLRYLRLGDHQMQPLTIAALTRLQDLEELRFNHGGHGEDAIELLQKLRLKRLWLRGWNDRDIVQALKDNATIEELTLRYHGQNPVDIAPLADMPKLRSLRLRPDQVVPGRGVNLPSALVMLQLDERGIEVRIDHGNLPSRPR